MPISYRLEEVTQAVDASFCEQEMGGTTIPYLYRQKI
jgi:hypothetical protein